MRESLRHGRPSRRRLVVLAALLAGSLLVCAGVAYRIQRTGVTDTSVLAWNLFLAWIPLVLALLVYDGARRGASRLLLLGGAGLWLLFLPNAPYIVTDAKWVGTWTGAPVLYDALLVAGAAAIGLVLGFVSVYLIQRTAARAWGNAAGWLVALASLALSGVGIYLGRILRWNSWDLFTRPSQLFSDVAAGVSDPLGYPRALTLTIAVALLLTVGYLLFYGLFRRELARLADG